MKIVERIDRRRHWYGCQVINGDDDGGPRAGGDRFRDLTENVSEVPKVELAAARHNDVPGTP